MSSIRKTSGYPREKNLVLKQRQISLFPVAHPLPGSRKYHAARCRRYLIPGLLPENGNADERVVDLLRSTSDMLR